VPASKLTPINFRFPDANTPGIMGFFQELPERIAALRAFESALAQGVMPTPDQVNRIVDLLSFFALDEPDKHVVRVYILDRMSMSDIAMACRLIANMAHGAAESSPAQAANRAVVEQTSVTQPVESALERMMRDADQWEAAQQIASRSH
jgi:hypothetical protein